MNLPIKTLTKIIEENNLVVIDTSALDAQNAGPARRKRYQEEIKRILAEKSGEICTTREILREREVVGQIGNLRRFRQLGNIGRTVSSIEAYLLPIAYDKGIIVPSKKEPLADVKLGALALALIHRPINVAFLSSDRKLNDLVQGVLDLGDERYEKGFPVLLRGDLTVYSFIQKRARFTPYVAERETFKSPNTQQEYSPR